MQTGTPCPESTIEAWGETLVAPIGAGRFPLSATIELTERCNMNCVHCYINQPAASKTALARELNTEQVKYLLDVITGAGCLYLGLTGGEILLRPDFAEIYMYARRKGLIVTLLTNATLIRPDLADLLAHARPHMVDITLYGASKATYETVTRTPGSFGRAIQGVELLLERKIPVSLKAMVITLNKHELGEMLALAERYGKELRFDGTIWPRLDGSQAPYQVRLSAQEMLEMDFFTENRSNEWEEQADKFSGQQVRNEYVFSCGAGLRSFHIDSAGMMSICTMVRKPAFDLMKTDFQQAWEAFGALRNKKRVLRTRCETCTVGALCTQCPGWSQAVHSDEETPVDYVCELGRQRAARIGTSVIEFIEEVSYEKESV